MNSMHRAWQFSSYGGLRNHAIGESQFQQPDPAVPEPALKPGTIITDRCFVMDENNRLWLIDPHDGIVDLYAVA